MLNYFDGTVFNADTQAIVNTVNCTGIMGAGIALEFMLRYPDMYNEYVNNCKNGSIKTGYVDYYLNSDGKTIINFPTKWHFKYPSKIEWIDQGLKNFADTFHQKGITSVAFPKLGTSNGGLEWDVVRKIMEKHLSGLGIDVYICLDTMKNAEGVEKIMLDRFNASDIEDLSKEVKLSAKQKDNLKKNMPYDRFWKIGETESVGAKTYSSLFRLFYSQKDNDKNTYKQMTLFD